jgi:creatinine amidohydrolase/Fe(II)-dependent formamide hydrolase-like protein
MEQSRRSSYNEYNMKSPGTVHGERDHFGSYCTDVVSSVARMGFHHVLLKNGHSSNAVLIEAAAKLLTMRIKAICASLSWFYRA